MALKLLLVLQLIAVSFALSATSGWYDTRPCKEVAFFAGALLAGALVIWQLCRAGIRSIRLWPSDVPLAALALWTMLSLLTRPQKWMGVEPLAVYLGLLLTYGAGRAAFGSARSVKALYIVFVAVGAAIASFGIFQCLEFGGTAMTLPRDGRAHSTMGNPNMLASFLNLWW